MTFLLSLAAVALAPAGEPSMLSRAEPIGNPGDWVLSSDYPMQSLRSGHEGRTGFRLQVGADGRVSDCEITQRSGYPELDEQACISLRLRGRFRPAKDSEGQFVADTYSSSVLWTIPGFDATPVNSHIEYVVTYDADGMIEDCEMVKAMRDDQPLDELDGDLCVMMVGHMTRIDPFTDEEGNPVSRKVRYRLQSTIED